MKNTLEKILVVDDERENIQLLHQGLKEQYTILAAMNGKEALSIAKEQLPNLILLDVMLQDESGYDVCKALKEDPITSSIPIIFVTARNSHEDEIEGLALGAVDYFRKPFSVPLIKMRIAMQLDLARKTEILEHLSSVDGLTGVANRRQFDEKLEQSIRYAERNHRGLSLMLIDVDFFKQYNDFYGHLKGDEALRLVAKALQKGASRPLDFVARFGGEEFAVLLIDSTPEEGTLVAEKLRSMIEELELPHEKSDLQKLTVSIGVSSIDTTTFTKVTSHKLINDADRCLYTAKAQGRNKIICSHLIID